MSMEFWGVEVKPGQPLKVTPEDGRIVHISQAALGEGKKEKGNDLIPLRLKIDNKKFIVASLSAENFPQITFDLVFEKEFELSHDWKNGSVYFCGYQIDNPTLSSDDDGDFDSDSSEEDELPVNTTENGKIEPKVEKAQLNASKSTPSKPESSAKPKVTVVEPKKEDESEDDESDEDEDEDDSDDDDLEDLEGDEDLPDGMDTDDEDDDSDEDDDVTPVAGKKRPTTSAAKTPTPAKKVKLASPLKSGKKGAQTATPHPSKQVGKTPANSSSKSKEQTPKSGGQVSCKSCSKTFNSENALQSHTKAKHSGK